MIVELFNRPICVATKKWMDVTIIRQQAIAGNIANIETPGYKRVDVSPKFIEELKRVIATGDVTKIGALNPKLEVDSTAVSRTRDGNTVHLEKELVELSQNYVSYSFQTQLFSGMLSKLRTAITGRNI